MHFKSNKIVREVFIVGSTVRFATATLDVLRLRLWATIRFKRILGKTRAVRHTRHHYGLWDSWRIHLHRPASAYRKTMYSDLASAGLSRCCFGL